ncbi:MAG: lyase family protein, partial [Pseudomonadota bacterium]
MVKTEIALARAQASLGIVPQEAASEIATLQPPDDASAVLADGVASSGVPVPALVGHLRQQMPDEAADWLHFGATSQDIVDTAFCLCAETALDDLALTLSALINALQDLSEAHANTLMLARTRGQLATPVTFGLRVAQWAQPLIGLEGELDALRRAALRVQLGGASGSRSVLGNSANNIATYMASVLGLTAGPPWHTDRSEIRRLANWLTRLVAATGKIGRDVSLMTRGEIAELRLSDAGGSSTMPHKSNPVTAEALQSLVPVAAGYEAGLAAASVHAEERDGAHWPVEWVLMPPLFETAGAALGHANKLLGNLVVDAEAMRERATSDASVLAEAAVFALAPKVGRVAAGRIV